MATELKLTLQGTICIFSTQRSRRFHCGHHETVCHPEPDRVRPTETPQALDQLLQFGLKTVDAESAALCGGNRSSITITIKITSTKPTGALVRPALSGRP